MINRTSTLSEIATHLESMGLVKAPTHNQAYTFRQIKNSCSLTNNDGKSRFFNRCFYLLKNHKWLNDKKIGPALFYEFLWLNGKCEEAISNQDYSNKNLLLNRIHVLGRIFDEIILVGYQAVDDLQDRARGNRANPRIAALFPIQMEQEVGAGVAKKIASHLKELKELFESETPHADLLNKCKVMDVSLNTVYVHRKKNEKLEEDSAQPQTQMIRDPLSLFAWERHGEKVEKIEITEKTEFKYNLWKDTEDEEKIQEICSVQLKLNAVALDYFTHEDPVPPFVIQLQLSRA